MEIAITEKGRLILAGMTFYGDPFGQEEGWSEGNEIGKLWSRFNAFFDRGGPWRALVVDDQVGYEVHIEPIEHAETKAFYVMVGVEVKGVEGLPPELGLRVLPPMTWAVCTLKGAEIASNWPDEIYQKWLPSSGYREALKITIERYDSRFKGPKDPESELEIWVPITEAGFRCRTPIS